MAGEPVELIGEARAGVAYQPVTAVGIIGICVDRDRGSRQVEGIAHDITGVVGRKQVFGAVGAGLGLPTHHRVRIRMTGQDRRSIRRHQHGLDVVEPVGHFRSKAIELGSRCTGPVTQGRPAVLLAGRP